MLSTVISEEALISSPVHSDCHTLKTDLWQSVYLMLLILNLAVCMVWEFKPVASFGVKRIFFCLLSKLHFQMKTLFLVFVGVVVRGCLGGVFVVGVICFGFCCNYRKSGMFYYVGII